MGSKPGCRETDAGGGREQNLFEQQGSERDGKQICLVPSAYSLDLGHTHPAVWKVTQDLPADMRL